MADTITYAPAQMAYEVWIASLYGSTTDAYTNGVKTWDNLPEKARLAWSATVLHIVNMVMDSCKQLESAQ